MFWDTFHWFVTLLEVVGVIVAILVLGLMSALVFLYVSGKLAGPPAVLDSDLDDPESGPPNASSDGSLDQQVFPPTHGKQ